MTAQRIMKKKIGILGGTFNPIHYGHLLIAENALAQYQLDEVCFIPAGIPPHKQHSGVLSGDLRCEMLQAAIADNPQFTMSKMELESDEISYTYRTLERLKEQHPDTELYFIMGADSLHDFPLWVRPEDICRLCTILVAVRDGIDTTKLVSLAADLSEKYQSDILLLNTPNVSISSQDIRRRVMEHQPIRYLLPDDVIRCIEKGHLYQTS